MIILEVRDLNFVRMPGNTEFKPQNTWEYLLTHYRGHFATLFLLPLSVLYNLWFYLRNKWVFFLKSAPAKHDQRVSKIVARIKQWQIAGATQPLCGSRSAWLSMSELVPLYKRYSHKIPLPLRDILEVNEEKQTVRVEPLVNMGQLTAQLIPMGWTLPVVPELDDLTVGGLINGFGVETSSHKYGLFQHICISFEIVTAAGEVVKCSATENPELFFSIPWSHGTLGFLVAAELRIIKASTYVAIQYEPLQGLDLLVQRFETESRKTEENDFVELLLYGPDEGVLMTGKWADHPGNNKINCIGRWYKPWFYQHVKTFLQKGKNIEYIPLRQYYHRHTRSFFWEMEEIIPFGNRFWYRFLLGWALPPRIALLKFFETDTTRQLREKYHVVQDMLMPVSKLRDAILYFHQHYLMYPLWICPMRIQENPTGIGFVHPYELAGGSKDELFVDIGAYGTPKQKAFDGYSALQKLESYVIENGGYQALYARTTMTEEALRQMFDHTTYDLLREKMPYCKKAFGDVYHKVGGNARVSGSIYKKDKGHNTFPDLSGPQKHPEITHLS